MSCISLLELYLLHAPSSTMHWSLLCPSFAVYVASALPLPSPTPSLCLPPLLPMCHTLIPLSRCQQSVEPGLWPQQSVEPGLWPQQSVEPGLWPQQSVEPGLWPQQSVEPGLWPQQSVEPGLWPQQSVEPGLWPQQSVEPGLWPQQSVEPGLWPLSHWLLTLQQTAAAVYCCRQLLLLLYLQQQVDDNWQHVHVWSLVVLYHDYAMVWPSTMSKPWSGPAPWVSHGVAQHHE